MFLKFLTVFLFVAGSSESRRNSRFDQMRADFYSSINQFANADPQRFQLMLGSGPLPTFESVEELFPPQIKSGEGLRQLYNKPVVEAQRVRRPLTSSGSMFGSYLGIDHEGVVLRTADGQRWLVHKGPDYGSTGGNTVVTNAKEMSKRWENVGKPRAVPRDGKMTIGDAVKAGGKHYNFLGNNCWDCADRVMDEVKKSG